MGQSEAEAGVNEAELYIYAYLKLKAGVLCRAAHDADVCPKHPQSSGIIVFSADDNTRPNALYHNLTDSRVLRERERERAHRGGIKTRNGAQFGQQSCTVPEGR